MWKVALPDMSSTSCSAARSSSDTVGAGSDANDVEQQSRREHDHALAYDLSLERHPQSDIHIGGAELARVIGRGELDA